MMDVRDIIETRFDPVGIEMRDLEDFGIRLEVWDPLESTCRHASLSIL